jgi:hypothetical protein
MINELITDLAHDKITLSQALTRTKLIANKIKSDVLKNWLVKELEGYEILDPYLPDYRKIFSPIILTAQFQFGHTQQIPVVLDDSFNDKTIELVKYHRVAESIFIVEQQIQNVTKAFGVIKLPAEMVQIMSGLYKDELDRTGGVLIDGKRDVGKIQFQNILEQTKQKLLDTLMELENEFPNLINEYKMTEENKDKVQNIITTHIYGENNPVSVAAGINVKQDITISNEKGIDYKELKKLGVEDSQIEELQAIVSDPKINKSTLTGKVMKWLGSVTSSIAARGLYDALPAITDFAHKLIA